MSKCVQRCVRSESLQSCLGLSEIKFIDMYMRYIFLHIEHRQTNIIVILARIIYKINELTLNLLRISLYDIQSYQYFSFINFIHLYKLHTSIYVQNLISKSCSSLSMSIRNKI